MEVLKSLTPINGRIWEICNPIQKSIEPNWLIQRPGLSSFCLGLSNPFKCRKILGVEDQIWSSDIIKLLFRLFINWDQMASSVVWVLIDNQQWKTSIHLLPPPSPPEKGSSPTMGLLNSLGCHWLRSLCVGLWDPTWRLWICQKWVLAVPSSFPHFLPHLHTSFPPCPCPYPVL